MPSVGIGRAVALVVIEGGDGAARQAATLLLDRLAPATVTELRSSSD